MSSLPPPNRRKPKPTPKPPPRPISPLPKPMPPRPVVPKPMPPTGPVINRPVSRPTGPAEVGGFDADREYPGPRVRGGPTNPGPMPLPPSGPMNPGPMPPPTGMGGGMKRGGKVRDKGQARFASGGSVSKTSSRGDGIAQRGKTKGRMC